MESIKQIVRTLSLEKSYLQKTGEHLIESQRDITHHPRSLPQEALPRSARFEEARKRAMKESPEQFKLLPLTEAATLWLDGKKLHIRKPRTLEAYQLYIRNLSRHLGECRLSELHIGHILEYQQSRRAEGASASYVNHETNTLAQILKRADLWDLIEKHYKPLPIGNWTPPKVMTPDEEARFFRAVCDNPSWSVAYWAVSITNNTSAMGTELRNLQLKHVHLDAPIPNIHIPDDKVKNEFRARAIPLNEEALKFVRLVIKRAESLGASQPEHYIFPFRVARNRYDVTRPATRSFIKRAFREMREATGLTWLQPRNFRNQVITKLFENGTPDETIISIAGHQSIKMSRYYSRIRVDAKLEALNGLKKPSAGTGKKEMENVG